VTVAGFTHHLQAGPGVLRAFRVTYQRSHLLRGVVVILCLPEKKSSRLTIRLRYRLQPFMLI
jgi:hypothetical protein